MAFYILPQRFAMRRATAAELASRNEVLLQGEYCTELDTGRFKIGNGETPWLDLDYAGYGVADLTDLADGDVLVWNAAAGKWLPGAGGGGGGTAPAFVRSATWTSRSVIDVANVRFVDAYCPAAATITGVTLLAQGGPGSCVVDIKKSAYPTFPPSASICASAKPAIIAAHHDQSTSLTGWTTAVDAGDVLRFVLESSSSFTDITISLHMDPA